MEAKLTETDKEAEKARKASKEAREEFNRIRKKRLVLKIVESIALTVCGRTDRFNKAYQHISERIDAVYKDLTKGPNAPLGGVAYLSLEDSEVSDTRLCLSTAITRAILGTISQWYQVSRYATHEAVP